MSKSLRVAAISITLLVCAALSTACVTSSDPHDGGFINGVRGIQNGTYQQRIDEQQQGLDELSRTREAMKRQLEKTNAQRLAAADQARALRADLVTLQKETERSRTEIDALRKAHRVRQEKLDSLISAKNAIERRVINLLKRYGADEDAAAPTAGTPSPEDMEAARALQQEQLDLKDAIRAAWGSDPKRPRP